MFGPVRLYLYLFCRGSCFIYAICIYIRILVSSKISILDDVRVALQ